MKERTGHENIDGADVARPARRHRRENRLLAGGIRGSLLRFQGCRRRSHLGVPQGRTAADGSEKRSSERPSAGDYDAVFYPGGHGPLWDLANVANSIALIETMLAAGQPVALVCHGPAALRYAKGSDGKPLVAGKSVTGFSNSQETAVGLTRVGPFLVQDMLKSNGGNYSKKANFQPYAITDGNLISGQNPASSEAGARALLDRLKADGKSGRTDRKGPSARSA